MTTLATASVAYGTAVGTVIGTVVPSQAGELDNLVLTANVIGAALVLNGDEITVNGVFVAQTYVLTINGTLDGSPMEPIQVTVTITGHTFPVVSTDTAGDVLTPKELAALRKKTRTAQAATKARRAKAERALNEAIEAARVKLYGPKVEKTALEPPKRLIGAVETAETVVADVGKDISDLKALIAQAWALIEQAQELQRQRDEQEEEDDVMILLAA